MARRTPTADPHLAGLLASAAEETQAVRAAEASRFALAVAWAEAHPAPVEDAPVDELGDLMMYADRPITPAGEGAPGMSEFAVAEFAAACGMTAIQGRDFIGAALECKYRLPKIWARVVAGEVAVWKVRRVTQATHRLDPYAAAYVDRHLAPVVHACSWAQVERAVECAAAEADPEYVEVKRTDQVQVQHFDIALEDARHNGGLVPVSGLLDYLDALALERQIAAGAHDLLADDPDLDLDVRRAMAAGRLGGAESVREVVVYAHHTPAESHGIVGVEQFGHTTLEQLEDWCAANGTRVSIRPILDLDEEITVAGYIPSDRQREQAILLTPTCVFPHCNRHARSCDLDHLEPHAQGGATTSWNLASH